MVEFVVLGFASAFIVAIAVVSVVTLLVARRLRVPPWAAVWPFLAATAATVGVAYWMLSHDRRGLGDVWYVSFILIHGCLLLGALHASAPVMRRLGATGVLLAVPWCLFALGYGALVLLAQRVH
ncbi:MAG: hypothetical protein U1F48_15900 [Burkholderiales bacterium]